MVADCRGSYNSYTNVGSFLRVSVLYNSQWMKCYVCDGHGIIGLLYPSECDLCNGGGLL